MYEVYYVQFGQVLGWKLSTVPGNTVLLTADHISSTVCAAALAPQQTYKIRAGLNLLFGPPRRERTCQNAVKTAEG